MARGRENVRNSVGTGKLAIQQVRQAQVIQRAKEFENVKPTFAEQDAAMMLMEHREVVRTGVTRSQS